MPDRCELGCQTHWDTHLAGILCTHDSYAASGSSMAEPRSCSVVAGVPRSTLVVWPPHHICMVRIEQCVPLGPPAGLSTKSTPFA
eukprot:364604-Chlamydomonas_euryale.AAC.17